MTASQRTNDVQSGDIERYHSAVIELADEVRRVATPMLERGFATEMKADASPVTEVDRAVEHRLREMIGRWFPTHGVIGEEYPPERPDSSFQWILDVIDGTEELIHGIPTWGAMLALHHRGTPLVGLIDHPAPTFGWMLPSGWALTGTGSAFICRRLLQAPAPRPFGSC